MSKYKPGDMSEHKHYTEVRKTKGELTVSKEQEQVGEPIRMGDMFKQQDGRTILQLWLANQVRPGG